MIERTGQVLFIWIIRKLHIYWDWIALKTILEHGYPIGIEAKHRFSKVLFFLGEFVYSVLLLSKLL